MNINILSMNWPSPRFSIQSLLQFCLPILILFVQCRAQMKCSTHHCMWHCHAVFPIISHVSVSNCYILRCYIVVTHTLRVRCGFHIHNLKHGQFSSKLQDLYTLSSRAWTCKSLDPLLDWLTPYNLGLDCISEGDVSLLKHLLRYFAACMPLFTMLNNE